MWMEMMGPTTLLLWRQEANNVQRRKREPWLPPGLCFLQRIAEKGEYHIIAPYC
jgi:hypothetical protein